MTQFKMLLLIIVVGSFQQMTSQERTNALNQDEELGKVSWYRNFDVAVQQAKKQNKPILILFQEVPGCATCRNYGHNVLSNPLMTEAIENEFIPLAIFNNKKGKDLEILRKYNEPTWNNPVVRIVNSKGENIVKRVASDYSAKGLYRAMVKAMENSGIPIPEYMKILGKELSFQQNPNMKETHFKMYCFWTGEKQLGSNEGVVSTKAGFMNGEVVKVTYDSEKIKKEELERFAQANKMRPIKDNGNFVWAEKDEDYYIQHSRFKYLPLSEIQKTKINSALGFRKGAQQYLSPKQREWFKKAGEMNGEVLFNKDFEKGWEMMIGSN